MNPQPDARLLLDEMFSPAVAAELRALGHDVIAVADRPDLRSKSDEEIFALLCLKQGTDRTSACSSSQSAWYTLPRAPRRSARGY
jgi:hypothetical protein